MRSPTMAVRVKIRRPSRRIVEPPCSQAVSRSEGTSCLLPILRRMPPHERHSTADSLPRRLARGGRQARRAARTPLAGRCARNALRRADAPRPAWPPCLSRASSRQGYLRRACLRARSATARDLSEAFAGTAVGKIVQSDGAPGRVRPHVGGARIRAGRRAGGRRRGRSATRSAGSSARRRLDGDAPERRRRRGGRALLLSSDRSARNRVVYERGTSRPSATCTRRNRISTSSSARPTSEIVERIDERTLLVPISHVLYKAGQIQDVEPISGGRTRSART